MKIPMSDATNFALKPEPFIKSELARTRNGSTFDLGAANWQFSTSSGQRYFDMERLESLCTPDFALGAKMTFVWYLENRSVLHAANLYARLLHFIEKMRPGLAGPVDCITEHLIYNYREVLDGSTEWYLGSLRGFFLKLKALGYPGVTPAAADLLEEITLKGNEKGWAVLTMDETEGPFTDAELRLIRGAVTKSFSEKRMTLRQCSLVWLYIQLGLRSAQVADLKIKDLKMSTGADGAVSYVLHVPRVKQRQQRRRAEFKERDLVSQIGQILESRCRQVEEDFGDKIADVRELPIFPCIRRTNTADPGFELHTDSANLRGEIDGIFTELSIISPRTCEAMKIVPRRFRYTLGTRAVIHGAGAAVVAELLDHSDVQNVLVYTKFSDELIEELNAELADDLEPLAQAFRGEIALFDEDCLSNPGNLIAYPGLDLKQGYTGKCRCGGECGDVPPIFCYACEHFTAFKGAPHDEALDLMLAEQAKEREQGNEVIARQLDEAIAACRAVIKKCQEDS